MQLPTGSRPRAARPGLPAANASKTNAAACRRTRIAWSRRRRLPSTAISVARRPSIIKRCGRADLSDFGLARGRIRRGRRFRLGELQAAHHARRRDLDFCRSAEAVETALDQIAAETAPLRFGHRGPAALCPLDGDTVAAGA